MLPEVTSDWVFYGLSGLFVAYLFVIFLTKSRRVKTRESAGGDTSRIDI